MLALKHIYRLFENLAIYSWVNEVWWPIPLILLLMAVGFLAFTAQVATPYIYTIF